MSSVLRITEIPCSAEGGKGCVPMDASRSTGKNKTISWTYHYPPGVAPYDGDLWDDPAWLDRLEEAYAWYLETVEFKQWAALAQSTETTVTTVTASPSKTCEQGSRHKQITIRR